MATIGTLAAFDPKNQTWDEYTEILEQFFAANQIAEADRQKAILISVVRAQTYSLMRNLLSPDKPKDKSFQELVLLIKKTTSIPSPVKLCKGTNLTLATASPMKLSWNMWLSCVVWRRTVTTATCCNRC